jgi:hypothetical protein
MRDKKRKAKTKTNGSKRPTEVNGWKVGDLADVPGLGVCLILKFSRSGGRAFVRDPIGFAWWTAVEFTQPPQAGRDKPLAYNIDPDPRQRPAGTTRAITRRAVIYARHFPDSPHYGNDDVNAHWKRN